MQFSLSKYNTAEIKLRVQPRSDETRQLFILLSIGRETEINIKDSYWL